MPDKNHILALLCFAIVIAFAMTSCKTVKPYQRKYLNDENMRLGTAANDQFSESVHTYREGASGGGNGKASGGCGCN